MKVSYVNRAIRNKHKIVGYVKMTARDWSKVGVYVPDPGAVVEVRENGGIWCGNDDRPFVPRSLQLKRNAAKAAKKRAKQQSKKLVGAQQPLDKRDKQKSKLLTASQLPLALRLPPAQVHLIRSVMADLGRPTPNKVKKLNKLLDRLVVSGVIRETGHFNLDHPILRGWLTKIERNQKQPKPTKTLKT